MKYLSHTVIADREQSSSIRKLLAMLTVVSLPEDADSIDVMIITPTLTEHEVYDEIRKVLFNYEVNSPEADNIIKAALLQLKINLVILKPETFQAPKAFLEYLDMSVITQLNIAIVRERLIFIDELDVLVGGQEHLSECVESITRIGDDHACSTYVACKVSKE